MQDPTSVQEDVPCRIEEKTMTKKISSAANSAIATEESRMKDQARKLHKALIALNPEVSPALTYAQTLEALSRSQGNRTLHVYKAQKPVVVEGKPLMDAARRMATRMFFTELGKWVGKELELLYELDAAFQQEENKGSRFIEARVYELTEESFVIVTPAYEHLRVNEWKPAYESLVVGLAEGLAAEANLEPGDCEPATLLKGLARDWRVSEGELSEDEPEAEPFEVTVARSAPGDQFYVDFVRPHHTGDQLEGTPQLSLFIEVNNGLPCVHMTNDSFGDQVLTVFFTKDGLYLRPDNNKGYIRTGAPSEGTDLAKVHALETVHPFEGHCNAFIENKV